MALVHSKAHLLLHILWSALEADRPNVNSLTSMLFPLVAAALTMAALPTIDFYSDIHCPWAYMALFRLRAVWPDYNDRVRVVFRALSLELKNERSTPKPILEVEGTLMNIQQPDLPIYAWRRPDWAYVTTLQPAFEAEQAAMRRGVEAERSLLLACARAVDSLFWKPRARSTRFVRTKATAVHSAPLGAWTTNDE